MPPNWGPIPLRLKLWQLAQLDKKEFSPWAIVTESVGMDFSSEDDSEPQEMTKQENPVKIKLEMINSIFFIGHPR